MAATVAQGGASNVAENINTDLTTQSQVILAQPTVDVAMTAIASALLASDPASNKNGGEYELLENANAESNVKPKRGARKGES